MENKKTRVITEDKKTMKNIRFLYARCRKAFAKVKNNIADKRTNAACPSEYVKAPPQTNKKINHKCFCFVNQAVAKKASANGDIRSEEHTSELQSRFDLVCRLLLE